MRAVVLVGGKATRLRPLTERTPKAMAPVLGRPFLEHLFAWLVRYGIREVTLLLGFLPGPIRGYFGDGHRLGMKLDYVVEDEPLGSGGAIKQLESELRHPFFALNGDIFTDLNLARMLAAHRSAAAELSIALTRVDDPSAYGVVALDGDGWIRRFVEKPPREEAPSDLVNAGVWLLQPEAVARISGGRFTMVEQELFPALAAERRLYGHVAEGVYWMDAGSPERYLQLQRDLLEGRAAGGLAIVERPGWPGLSVQPASGEPGGDGSAPVLGSGATLTGAVVLGARVTAGAGCAIAGPTTIGADTRLGDGVTIRDSILWEDCTIGDRATIEGSILARGCVVAEGAALEACVLGERATVAAGARLGGVRADYGTVL